MITDSTPSTEPREEKLDLRLYLGMFFFRWKVISVCLLLGLLGGVLYVNWTPKRYGSHCVIMMYRDPNSMVSRSNPYAAYNTLIHVVRSGPVIQRVTEQLFDEWGEAMGGQGNMRLPVTARVNRGLETTLVVSAQSSKPKYAEAFLETLLEEARKEWDSMQMERINSATALLEKELSEMEEKIRAAEDDLFEYQRLHDVRRVKLKGENETRYIEGLIAREQALSTQIMLMEHQFPELRDENVGVLLEVERLTRESSEETSVGVQEESGEESNATEGSDTTVDKKGDTTLAGNDLDVVGWVDVRFRIAQLEQRRNELLQNLTAEHPEVKRLTAQIENLQKELNVAAELKMERMRDRYKALLLQLKAVEAAEYKWQAKYMTDSQRYNRLERLSNVVGRYESIYRSLYDRLHSIRANEELKVEYYRVITPPRTNPKPVWPDPVKILLTAIVLGIGSGVGIALTAQLLDNKVQSIKDVENELRMRFLGGVPFWVHSGLEKAIRPIVTEEHSSGAIEAYRALRTTLITELNKLHEKIVIITSADSREGKTLTALNLAIMTAQMGKKVLLIDMDLRRGRLHRSLGLPREPGVTDVLEDKRSLREVILQSRVENLDLAPTGRSIDDAAEILQSADLMGLFVDVQDDYDYIFIDTSPILRVTDTVILASQGIGCVVYIARVNHTPKPLIKYSLEMLREANVLGLIMNSIEMHKISSLYYTYQYPNYAYYSNAYAYGYSYYNYGEGRGRGGKRSRRGGRWRSMVRGTQRWMRQNLFPMG